MANPTTNLGMTLPIGEGSSSKVQDYNAALQILDALFGAGVAAAWASWTPTWTNLTLGNGVVVARYAKIGKLVFCRLSLVFGNTPTAVTGDVIFTLPTNRAAYAGTASITPLGQLLAFDTSGSSVVPGCVVNFSVSQGAARVYKSDGTYLTEVVMSATVPFTWAVGDEINCEFFYESA